MSGFKLPIIGGNEIPDPVQKDNVVLPEDTIPKLLVQALDDAEIAKTVTFGGTPSEPLKVLEAKEVAPPTKRGSFLARLQENAVDFSDEGESVNGIVFENMVDSAIGVYVEPKSTSKAEEKPQDLAKERAERDSRGTQDKIANADEDGTAEFDDGGANVATADSGADQSVYAAEEEVGNWGDDSDGDDGPVSRSEAGLESEMDDDTSQVPKGLLDEDE